jgi:hypothetical protein
MAFVLLEAEAHANEFVKEQAVSLGFSLRMVDFAWLSRDGHRLHPC